MILGRIRGQGHARVARGCQWLSLSLLFPFAVTRAGASAPVVILLALFSCSSHAGGGRGLLTAPALGVGALGLAVTALDPGIETGRVVTACVVPGGGRLTAPGLVIGVRVFSLPAGGERHDRERSHALPHRSRSCERLPGSCPLASGGARTAGQT